jgi:hypothetical protein
MIPGGYPLGSVRKNITRGVSHSSLVIYIKSILMQKMNYENSNISPCKNIIFKKSSKSNQNPSRYYNPGTTPKFQTQAKVSSFKNPHIKIDLLPRGQNPLTDYPSTFSGLAQIILFSLLSKISQKKNNIECQKN